MDPYLVKIYTAAGMASGAAIFAVLSDRLRNVPAASFAFAGGILPWLTVALLFRWPNGIALTLGLIWPGPLFLMALLFYSFAEPSFTRSTAIACTAVGLFAGLSFSAFVAYPFLVSN